MEYRFNDKYPENNFGYTLESQTNSLNLDRVIVITTSSTASASEIVISGLAPHIEVVTIGGATNGKPYLSLGRSYCGKIINATEAEGFNAAGVSVFGGIQPTCGSTDNPITDYGVSSDTQQLDDMDSMLADSIRYITDGTCKPTTGIIQAARSSEDPRGFESWVKQDQLPVGAFELR